MPSGTMLTLAAVTVPSAAGCPCGITLTRVPGARSAGVPAACLLIWVVPVRVTVSVVPDAAGTPTFVLAMVEDMRLALIDQLTGLDNRRAFLACALGEHTEDLSSP